MFVTLVTSLGIRRQFLMWTSNMLNTLSWVFCPQQYLMSDFSTLMSARYFSHSCCSRCPPSHRGCEGSEELAGWAGGNPPQTNTQLQPRPSKIQSISLHKSTQPSGWLFPEHKHLFTKSDDFNQKFSLISHYTTCRKNNLFLSFSVTSFLGVLTLYVRHFLLFPLLTNLYSSP